ncbi:MAG TPA: hypothetical protein VGR30_07740 [Candidatus Binatia bacterium]|nr:hypothetical protein [Candidatus Binatia bacterium]
MPEAYRLYAGTQAGMIILRGVGDIWTSMGGSREFEPYFKDQVVDSVYGCRKSPEVVYAGVTFDGLYRTKEGGKRWQRVLEGDIRWVTTDPTDERVVYAGTEPVHLYRSEDGGNSWEELKGLLKLPEEVRRSWWFPRPPHEGHVRHIYIDQENPNCIYLALEHGGIVRSFDRGKTWEDVSEGLEYPDIHMIVRSPSSSTKFFAATSRGFFQADPPEKGWKRAERGMDSDYFHDLILLPGSPAAMFLAAGHGSPQYWDRPTGADGRIYRSEDGGKTWRQVGAGLPVKHKAMCWQLAYNPYNANSIFAAFGDVARGHVAGPPGEGAIYVTYDRGDSWEEVGSQKRGKNFLRPPAIRVLWAAADD